MITTLWSESELGDWKLGMLQQRQRGYYERLPLHCKGYLWIVHIAIMM